MRQNLEQERVDGELARQLLDNRVFKQAWKSAEDSIVAQMAEVKIRDVEMHTKLILAMQILNSVRRHIEVVLETGQMADLQLSNPGKVSAFR